LAFARNWRIANPRRSEIHKHPDSQIIASKALAIIFCPALYGSVGTKGTGASANLRRAEAIPPARCMSLTYATIRGRIALKLDGTAFDGRGSRKRAAPMNEIEETR